MAAPPSRKKSSSSSSGRRDRISGLPDDVLGHVLSYLPNKEAGRAAALGHRWRDIFCSVHTISFEEEEGEREEDWYTYFLEAEEQRSCSVQLIDTISAALLRRRRRYGSAATSLPVPLRSLRFAFDRYDNWDKAAVDQWLFDVLRHAEKELHLDLRFFIGPICPREDDDEKGSDNEDWGYVLPRRLYSCTVVRTLCIGHCKLNLPEAINLPFLETLRLTGILGDDSGETIQKFISGCPRIADLTLETNRSLKKVFVLDKCLRRFALRCCHDLMKVSIDASELRSMDYSGAVPEESLLSLHGSPAISSCTVKFCKVTPTKSEFTRFRRFLKKVSPSKHLPLHHRGLDTRFFAVFPSFPTLTRLELHGPIRNSDAVDAVRRILEQTPNLEVLSLDMDDRERREKEEEEEEEAMYPERFNRRGVDDDQEQYHKSSDDPVELKVPNRLSFSIRCLRRRVKDINMDSYRCDVQHRVLASLLFRNALVLERMCVGFVKKGSSKLQAELTKEIESWLVGKPEKSFK
ncbi:hypothetical protein VPH35_031846 [Triticum aestivum]|uniref:F-box/LRR-repeat protein At1g06630-like n=1 Tax=Triticum aestivum TaxID=4565 RepID=UPI001D0131EC|nr:F-box/LRR-repeat protein At1g06630-like [Triticum aestivum]